MENLDQKIKEFSDYILQTPEFARFQKAVEKLEKDKGALSAIKDVQGRVEAISALQEKGLAVSDKQSQELNAAQAKMLANKICVEFFKEQDAATAVASEICEKLTEATGISFFDEGNCGCDDDCECGEDCCG